MVFSDGTHRLGFDFKILFVVWRMDSQSLLVVISTLDHDTPLTRELECLLEIGPGFGAAKYKHQRHHWQTWLATYHDPQSTRRAYRPRTDAEAIYNRLNCPPMAFWLAEALGAPQGDLRRAINAACKAPSKQASQTAAVRAFLPWRMLERHLLARSAKVVERVAAFPGQSLD